MPVLPRTNLKRPIARERIGRSGGGVSEIRILRHEIEKGLRRAVARKLRRPDVDGAAHASDNQFASSTDGRTDTVQAMDRP